MRAGQLNRRITIEQKKETRGSTGEELVSTGDWITLCSAWANVIPLSGSEYVAGKEMESEVTVRVIIRARKDVTITNDMRVKDGTQYYEIVAPPREIYQRNRQLELLCKEYPG